MPNKERQNLSLLSDQNGAVTGVRLNARMFAIPALMEIISLQLEQLHTYPRWIQIRTQGKMIRFPTDLESTRQALADPKKRQRLYRGIENILRDTDEITIYEWRQNTLPSDIILQRVANEPKIRYNGSMVLDGTRILPEKTSGLAAYKDALRGAIDDASRNEALVFHRADAADTFLEADLLPPPCPLNQILPYHISSQMTRMVLHAIIRPAGLELHSNTVVVNAALQGEYPLPGKTLHEPTATFTFDLDEGLVTLTSENLQSHHASVIGGLQHPIDSPVFGELTKLTKEILLNPTIRVVKPTIPHAA